MARKKPAKPSPIEDKDLDKASGGTLSVGTTDNPPTGVSHRGRTPGKINVNTIWD